VWKWNEKEEEILRNKNLKIVKADFENNSMRILEGHKDEITSLVVDLGNIWTSSKDGKIKKWTNEGECLKTINVNQHLKYKVIPKSSIKKSLILWK